MKLRKMFFNSSSFAFLCPHFKFSAVASFVFLWSLSLSFADFGSSDSANLSNIRSNVDSIERTFGYYAPTVKYFFDALDQNGNHVTAADIQYLLRAIAMTDTPRDGRYRRLPETAYDSLLVLRQILSAIPSNFVSNVSVTNVFQPYMAITNVIYPTFSITNIVPSVSVVVTNDFNPNIIITNEAPIIQNVVSNFITIASTNQQAGVPLDLSIITNLLLATGFVSNKGISEEQLLNYAIQNGFYTAFSLNPYYWANSGFVAPLRTTSQNIEKSFNAKLQNATGLVGSQFTLLQNSLSTFHDIAKQFLPPATDNLYDYEDYATRSEIAKEALYGTFDIEEMFRASTNHIAEISNIGPRIDNLEVVISNGFETVVMSLYQFTNLMQNVSVSSLVTSNQFADALQDSADTMPLAFTDTSVTSISNATIYATEDSGYSTLLNENAVDLNSFDYSRFETSVRSFVQVWESGVNVGSPTLNIHFAGVDTGQGNPTLEQTIDLDFELPQSAKDKISAFWSAVFALIRGSLILWGFFRLFNAVLNANRRESSSGHTDFTNVDVD